MKNNQYKEIFKKLQNNKLIPLDIDLLSNEDLELLKEQSKIFNGLRASDSIYIKIKFNENYLIPYDINLLNTEEKNKLKKEIENQLFVFNIEYDDLIFNNICYKIIEFKIKEIEEKNYLMNEINKVYNDYKKMLNYYNEENKAIFERVLIKEELVNF